MVRWSLSIRADVKVELSARNLRNVKVLRAEGVNVYDVLKYPYLVLTDAAVTEIEGALKNETSSRDYSQAADY